MTEDSYKNGFPLSFLQYLMWLWWWYKKGILRKHIVKTESKSVLLCYAFSKEETVQILLILDLGTRCGWVVSVTGARVKNLLPLRGIEPRPSSMYVVRHCWGDIKLMKWHRIRSRGGVCGDSKEPPRFSLNERACFLLGTKMKHLKLRGANITMTRQPADIMVLEFPDSKQSCV
jgi:hypothetical protein